MMKKIFALMLAVAFGLGTIGCDDKKAEKKDDKKVGSDKKDETKKDETKKDEKKM
jgi:hypothetical protein